MLEVELAVDVAAFVDGVVAGYYSSVVADFGVFDPVHVFVASVDHLAAA